MSSPAYPTPHSDHDPFSKESLDAVESVEALPFSTAFEHVMFEARLDRTVSYFYKTKPVEEGEGFDPTDIDPLVLEPGIMLGFFPEYLRPIFPGLAYTIEQLEAQQIESQEGWVLQIHFKANGIEHQLHTTRSGTLYSTLNESLEPVSYNFPLETSVGLLASFTYARQVDPVQNRFSVELSEPKISIGRDTTAGLVEQILMTLGEHSGHSASETRALFETATGDPILATLRDEEYPDKSKTENSLYISEIVDANSITTSVETTLYQDIVNIDIPHDL